MIWIIPIVIIALCVLFMHNSGFKVVSEKRLVYDFMHENEPSYWSALNSIKGAGTMDELNKSYQSSYEFVEWFCNRIRTITENSGFGDNVASKYYEKFRDAVDDAIKNIKQNALSES